MELAKLKNVGKASVTKALKILEEEGFIKRILDENDRRNILCYITEKGASIVGGLMDVKDSAENKMFKNFQEQDKEKLYEYLSKLYFNSKMLC